MISREDCICMCGLTREEVEAIAEHEHVPEIVATALGQYLMRSDVGPLLIRDMIVDDIKSAQASGDAAHTQQLLHVLHHYLRAHPEARPG